MNRIRDEQYKFDGPGGPARCHLQVYQGEDGPILALATELPDNPGVSITAWADHLAYQVWQEVGEPPVFTWIEHYPADTRAGLGESYALVQFAQTPNGTFTSPRWQPLTQETVGAWITQPEGTTDIGVSLPPQHLRLACATCGQPLAVSEVLAGARQCAACAAGRPPQVAQETASTEDKLAAARAAWLERTNAHEIRLGLTRRQRAALRGALQGHRSLWSFSAAELYALVEQLEQLSDAAAVQSFLEMHAGDTGLSPGDWQ